MNKCRSNYYKTFSSSCETLESIFESASTIPSTFSNYSSLWIKCLSEERIVCCWTKEIKTKLAPWSWSFLGIRSSNFKRMEKMCSKDRQNRASFSILWILCSFNIPNQNNDRFSSNAWNIIYLVCTVHSNLRLPWLVTSADPNLFFLFLILLNIFLSCQATKMIEAISVIEN